MAESVNREIEETVGSVIPPEITERIDRMVAELRERNAVPGVPVGEQAPDFTLRDAHGNPVTLSDRVGKGPVVLSFYRGDWCPICNVELRALQRHLPAITDLGASLVAVNPQAPDRSLTFAETLELGFDVLSDLEQEVAAAYRIRFPLGDSLREIYEQHLPLPDHNADGSWNLPVPATFIIDTDGIVRARHVDADYRTRMEPEDLMAALRAIA
ncbi:MAG: peroxiredoxin-like family protein [Acidimicrobiia bacterium]